MKSRPSAWRRPTERAFLATLKREVAEKRKAGQHEVANDTAQKYLREGEMPIPPSWEDVVLRSGGRVYRP